MISKNMKQKLNEIVANSNLETMKKEVETSQIAERLGVTHDSYRYTDQYIANGQRYYITYCPKCKGFERTTGHIDICACGNTSRNVYLNTVLHTVGNVLSIKEYCPEEKSFIFETYVPAFKVKNNNVDLNADDFEYLKQYEFKLDDQAYSSLNIHVFGIFSETDGLYLTNFNNNQIRKNGYFYKRVESILLNSLPSSQNIILHMNRLSTLKIFNDTQFYSYIKKCFNDQKKAKNDRKKKRVKIDYFAMDSNYDYTKDLSFPKKPMHAGELDSEFKGVSTYNVYCNSDPSVMYQVKKADGEAGGYICPVCHNTANIYNLNNRYNGPYMQYGISDNNDLFIIAFNIYTEMKNNAFSYRYLPSLCVFASPEKLRIYSMHSTNTSNLTPIRINSFSNMRFALTQTPEEICEIIKKSSMRDAGLLEVYGFKEKAAIDSFCALNSRSYLYNYYKKTGIDVLIKQGYSSLARSVIYSDIVLDKNGTTAYDILGTSKEVFELLIHTSNNVDDIPRLEDWSSKGADSQMIHKCMFYNIFTPASAETMKFITDTLGISVKELLDRADEATFTYCCTYSEYLSRYAKYLKVADELGLDLNDQSVAKPKDSMPRFEAYLNLFTALSSDIMFESFQNIQKNFSDILCSKKTSLKNEHFNINVQMDPLTLAKDMIYSGFSIGFIYKYFYYEFEAYGAISITKPGSRHIEAVIFVNPTDMAFTIDSLKENDTELSSYCNLVAQSLSK